MKRTVTEVSHAKKQRFKYNHTVTTNTHHSNRNGSLFKTDRVPTRPSQRELKTPKNLNDQESANRFFRANASNQSTKHRSIGPRKANIKKFKSFKTKASFSMKKTSVTNTKTSVAPAVINLKKKRKISVPVKKKSRIQSIMDKKLKLLSNFININDKKLRRNMSERRTLLEKEAPRGEKSMRLKTLNRKFKFGKMNQKLKNFFRSKLDKAMENQKLEMKNDILCEEVVMTDRDMTDHQLTSFPKKVTPTKAHKSFQTLKDLEFREILDLTGEKNRIIMNIMRGRNLVI